MAEKIFKGAPFGTQSARFDVSAVHPKNKRVGTYTQISYCKRKTSELERNLGPGTHNNDRGDFSALAVQERAKGPGWKREQEVAWLTQIPHLLYRDAWESKQFLKTNVGPGTYSIPSFTEELEKKPGSVRGICETREERFKDCQSLTPGPGTYGERGIPSSAIKKREQRSVMDLHNNLHRFPHNISQDSGLGPGTYYLKSSTDQILNRRVSKRGPFDLFTGCRNKPIAYGHFAAPVRLNLNSVEYTKESPVFGEDFQKPEKRTHGVFSRLEQSSAKPTERIYLSTLSQCPRPSTFPGPGWYDVIPKNPVHQLRSATLAPFLSSAPRISKRIEALVNKNHNMVGPGNYNTEKLSHNQNTNGLSSSFKSGTQRYPHCPARDKYIQERLRPANVPLNKRVYIQPPDPSLQMNSSA